MKYQKLLGSRHDELEDLLLEEEPTNGSIAPWFRCIAARIMNEEWWSAVGDSSALAELADDEIHDMGDVTHMLPEAEGAGLRYFSSRGEASC